MFLNKNKLQFYYLHYEYQFNLWRKSGYCTLCQQEKTGFELAYCTKCNSKKVDPNQNTISSAHLEAGIVHVQNFDKKAQSAANLNLLINQKSCQHLIKYQCTMEYLKTYRNQSDNT